MLVKKQTAPTTEDAKPVATRKTPDARQTADQSPDQSKPKKRTARKPEPEPVSEPVARPTINRVPAKPKAVSVPVAQPQPNPVLLRKAEAEAIHSYAVHRLPHYETDHRSDAKAEADYLGEVAATGNYVKEIAARFGSGYYRITERRVNGTMGKAQVLALPDVNDLLPVTDETDDDELADSDFEGLLDDDSVSEREMRLAVELARLKERERMREEMARLQAAQPRAEARPTPQPSASASLKEQLEILLTLDKLRGGSQPATPPADPLETFERMEKLRQMLQPERPPESKIGEQLTELAIKRLLDGLENGTDSPSEESFLPSWLRPVVPIAKALGQGAMAALADKFLGDMGEGEEMIESEPEPQPIAPPRPALAARSSDPASPNPPLTVAPKQRRALSPQEALQIVFQDLANDAPVARSVNIIKQLMHNKQYRGLMEGWMTTTPRELMEGLSEFPDYAPLMRLPHTEHWLAELIEGVTGQSPQTGNEPEPEVDKDAGKKVFDNAA